MAKSIGDTMMDRYMELADKEPFATLETLYFAFEEARGPDEQREAQLTLQAAILEAAELFPDRSVFEDCLAESFPAVDAFDPGRDHTIKFAQSLWTRPPFYYGAAEVHNDDGSITRKAVNTISVD